MCAGHTIAISRGLNFEHSEAFLKQNTYKKKKKILNDSSRQNSGRAGAATIFEVGQHKSDIRITAKLSFRRTRSISYV